MNTQVEYGGRTVFPGLGIHVNPEQGSALFWYTLNSQEDYDSRYRSPGKLAKFKYTYIYLYTLL